MPNLVEGCRLEDCLYAARAACLPSCRQVALPSRVARGLTVIAARFGPLIDALGGVVSTIDGERHLELPDGREVVVQRHRAQWIVRCDNSRAISDNLDVALAEAIHAATLSLPHRREVHYPTWIRGVADQISSSW